MTVVAITMVRDEADIVGHTVAHMVKEVDHVIVLDNGSTDGTRDILDTLPITVLDDPEVGYYQSRKLTALAHRARIDHDATWVVPFDADELWYQPDGRVADALEQLDPMWAIAPAVLHDHVATGEDPDDPNPVARIGWRRIQAGALPKVACRTGEDLVIGQGNHDARYDAPAPTCEPFLRIRHFPYRSADQFVRKAKNGAAAYAATDLPEDVGRHWREYGRLAETYGDDALRDVFRRWFWTANPEDDPTLMFDPA